MRLIQPSKNMPGGSTHRTCPICHATRHKLIFKQRFGGRPAGSLLTGYDVVSCGKCGFAYADGIPKQVDFDRYYRNFSKYEYAHHGGAVSASDRKTFRQLADFIRKIGVDRHSSILDVGCATGALLRELQKRGFRNIHGLDPSPACAATARRLYGLPVMAGSVFDLEQRHGQYDLIILTGVLEHLRDLPEAMRRLFDRLTPQGQLFVGVPDAMGYAAARNAPFQQFSVEHINFFSPVSLANLMATYNLRRIAQMRMMREQGIGTTEPIIAGLYRRATGPIKIRHDSGSRTALQQYVSRSRHIDRHTHKIIRQATSGGQKVIIWGVGTLAQRLLATGSLRADHIAAFVDSNPKMWGKKLAGKRIISPSELHQHKEPIIIASWMFQEEILNMIQQSLQLSNAVISLYDLRVGSRFKS